MALTEEKRQALIAWLESMSWWDELPYAQLEAEIAGMKLMEIEGEEFAATIVRENEQLKVVKERVQELRNELASLYDENEPHDMGGPHIQLTWVIERIDKALEQSE